MKSHFFVVERSAVLGRRKLSVSRENLYSEADLLHLCRVGDSKRKLEVTEEGQRKWRMTMIDGAWGRRKRRKSQKWKRGAVNHTGSISGF